MHGTTRLAVALLLLAVLSGCRAACCAGRSSAPRATQAASAAQVFADLSVVSMPAAQAEALLAALPPADAQGARVLDRAAGSEFWKRAHGEPTATVTASAKMLMLEGQEGTVFLGEDAGSPMTFSGWRFATTARVAGDGRLAVDLQHWAGSEAGASSTLGVRGALLRSGQTLVLVEAAPADPSGARRMQVASYRLLPAEPAGALSLP